MSDCSSTQRLDIWTTGNLSLSFTEVSKIPNLESPYLKWIQEAFTAEPLINDSRMIHRCPTYSGCAKGAAKGSCGETVVQKGVFGESVSSLPP